MSYSPIIPAQTNNDNVIFSNQWISLGYTAYKLFDDDLSTFWSTTEGANTNQYCGIHLETPEIAVRVGINPRQWNNVVQIHDFKIQGSNDGNTWEDLLVESVPNNASIAGTWVYYDFSNTTAYSYYRLYVINANTSRTITIFEMQLFKDDTPTPPVPTTGFTIILQTNNSEKNKLDKDIIDIIALNGVLKNETSIINPVILIEGNLSDFIFCNYMTIPVFNRKYFITNIRSIRTNLFEISAHVDVLSSFSAQIRSNTAIVHRQENRWNLYLNDGTFRTYQNPMVLTREFPNGFTTQEFVLAVAGS